MKRFTRSAYLAPFFLSVLACLTPAIRAFSADRTEEPRPAAPSATVPVEVQALMQDRDYKAAIAAIEQAIAAGRGPADFLTYLKGRAFHHQKQYDDAARTFDTLVAEYADSPWVRPQNLPRGRPWPGKGTIAPPS